MRKLANEDKPQVVTACREQSSTDAGDDQNKLREASWKIEIYMNVEEEEGSSVEKEPFKGGQRQLSDGC